MNHSFRKDNIPVPVRFFLYIVICPSLLASIYYGLIASDIYISEARYAIRSNSDTPMTGMFDSLLTSGMGMSGGSPASEDAQIVKDYSLSHSMVEQLGERLNLRKHFTSKNIDFLSRFDENSSMEELLEYYQEIVEIDIDSGTNITTLRVRAFTPEKAKEIADTIINISEDLVNRMSDRMVNDFLRFARDEVGHAEQRVKATSKELTRFRSENRSIDPGEETSAVLGIVTELETQLATSRTELLEARSYLTRDSLQIKVLESKVAALEDQVTSERTRLANTDSMSIDFTKLIDLYEPLVLEQQLAREFYTSALSSLELARAEAQRKQRYLITFVEPKISDEAVEPERFYAISTVFALLLVIYGIGGLIWAAIKDHMRI